MEIRKVLFDNWGIKLLSLGLALMLWFFVTSKGRTETTLLVPLELRNVPQNMAVVGDVVSSIEIRIQGPERVLRDITTGKRVFGILDLARAKVGENMIPVSPDDIRTPAGAAVTHMSLSEVKVRLEPLARKSIRLRPVLHGTPAAGYRIAKVTITPSKIIVEGPANVLGTLESLASLPIDVQGADAGLTVEPKVDYQGKSLKIIDTDIIARIAIERIRK